MVMAPAQTLAEREARRQKLRDYALAHALDHHLTARCRWASDGGLDVTEHGCMAEAPGRSGCLCTCHDGPADGQKPPAP